MADEKRIVEFEPATQLEIDDWFAVDSPNMGTRKIQKSMFMADEIASLQTLSTAMGLAQTDIGNLQTRAGMSQDLNFGDNLTDGVNVLSVLLGAEPYINTRTYAVGEYCVYEKKLYKCTTAVSSAEDFDSDKWTLTNVRAELTALNTSLTPISIGINNLITAGAFNVQYATANKSGNVLTLVMLMRGKGQNVPAGTTLATIKSGYRPKQDLYIPVADNNSVSSYLKILANGNIVSDFAYTTTHTSLLIVTSTYII